MSDRRKGSTGPSPSDHTREDTEAGDERLLALAYCMLSFGEMLKQASHGSVMQAYSGAIALRDKLAHVPHRKLNPEVLAASVERATIEILPLMKARIEDLRPETQP